MNKDRKFLRGVISFGVALMITATLFLLYSYINNPELFMENIFYRYTSLAQGIIYITFQLTFASCIYLTANYLQSIKHRQYAVLEIIPQAVIIYTLTGRVIFANRFACEKYSVEQDKASGLNILDFLVERDRSRAMEAIKEHITGKYTGLGADKGIVINDYITLTGTGKEIQSTVYAGRFSPGNLIAVLVDNTEIEDVKQVYTEQAEFFWELLNNMHVPFSYNDVDGDFKFVNTAFQKLIGLDERDILGKNLKEILTDKDYESANKRREYVLSSGESVEYETIINLRDRQMAMFVNMIPHILSGHRLGIFQTTIDITEQKKKDALLKKEIHLTKTLNEISSLMFSSTAENINKNTDKVLGIIRKSLGICRCYLIIDHDGSISVANEDVEPDLKPYSGLVFNMSKNNEKFYRNFMSKKATIKANNVSMSKYANLEHFKIFKMRSVVEVAIPGSNASENPIVVGACSVIKYKNFTSSEIEFLSSAGRSIASAIDRIDSVNNLKLSEETLSTLIDNTDIGIVITNNAGRVFYTNGRFEDMFGPLKQSKHISVIGQFATKDHRDKALSLYKDREYKGFGSGTIKAVNRHGYEIYIKIYSARIDYEGSKAYLTTVVDVTEYMVEDI